VDPRKKVSPSVDFDLWGWRKEGKLRADQSRTRKGEVTIHQVEKVGRGETFLIKKKSTRRRRGEQSSTLKGTMNGGKGERRQKLDPVGFDDDGIG